MAAFERVKEFREENWYINLDLLMFYIWTPSHFKYISLSNFASLLLLSLGIKIFFLDFSTAIVIRDKNIFF